MEKSMRDRKGKGKLKSEHEGQHSRRLLTSATTHAVEEGNTFLLSGGAGGGPSSFPSGLIGMGNLDSPGVIISARPIGANRKHRRDSLAISHCIPAAENG